MNRAIRIIGISLAIVAGGFFLVHAHRALAGHDLSSLLDAGALAALALLTALYTASILTTAAAWSRQLRDVGHPHRFPLFLAVLAATQFGKYLPGNVGHHLGRVALARRFGVGLSAATLTIGYELLLALMASAHLAALVLVVAPPDALVHPDLLRYRWPLIALISIGALAGLFLAPTLAAWLLRLRARRAGDPGVARNLALGFPAMAFSYLMYVAGVCMVGFGLWAMARALVEGGATVPAPFFFIGTFAASWILGLVVPGAPAGLGVREAVLTAWLSQSLPGPAVIVLVVALRIATTTGDLVNFAWGSALLMRQGRVDTAGSGE